MIPVVTLSLCLVWIWKADMVKAYYSKMKNLEAEKKELINEISGNTTILAELKSLSEIEKVVTARFGLTQKVMGRIIISDPVKSKKSETKSYLVEHPGVYDWIEDAVFGAGKVSAEPQRMKGPRAK